MNQINLTWRLLEVIVRANETKHATTTLKNTEALGRDIVFDEEQRVESGQCAVKTCYMGIDGTGVLITK